MTDTNYRGDANRLGTSTRQIYRRHTSGARNCLLDLPIEPMRSRAHHKPQNIHMWHRRFSPLAKPFVQSSSGIRLSYRRLFGRSAYRTGQLTLTELLVSRA